MSLSLDCAKSKDYAFFCFYLIVSMLGMRHALFIGNSKLRSPPVRNPGATLKREEADEPVVSSSNRVSLAKPVSLGTCEPPFVDPSTLIVVRMAGSEAGETRSR